MPSSPTYKMEVRHYRLNKYRLIKGKDRYEVEQKAAAQTRAWDEMWEKKQAAEAIRLNREMAVQEKEEKKNLAAERTAEAQTILSGIERTLAHALDSNNRIEWDSLLDHNLFPKSPPPEPTWHLFPKEPKETDSEFKPSRKWYHMIFKRLRQKAEEQAKSRFILASENWHKQMIQAGTNNKSVAEQYKLDIEQCQSEKKQYEQEQAQKNAKIIQKKTAYFDRDVHAVVEYCDMVLSSSQYPDTFPQEWNLEYQAETKMIVVDYFLPAPENVPTLKEVRYFTSKDEFTEVHLQESAFNKFYDGLLYQITLRTTYEIFESDQCDSIITVVFNGWIRSLDKGTGKPITICVLSLQTSREEFQKIDLKQVDPKICFKALKGVGSSKLHGLSPVAPVLQLSKEDKRFVSSYSVVGDIDQSTNIAAMDWEDFEHLIREVFEKEFSQNGGEVKITQASRDGGVDAIAFDPDPIRGGKIVIQAKRYTNTVGVSAVRDLYGTVLNEGATKGILVTTADYGPDAYTFAKGKPLTLLSGANLLHLLEKHGHKAKIDIKAAKQILADQKREQKS